MSSAVVRVGDVGSHANVMIVGSPNVIVNNQKAHRQYDIFVCPAHGVGVSILNVSPSVIINNNPAVKVGSLGIDAGGLPANIVGSPNVNVA